MSFDGIAIVIVIVLLVWLFQVDFTASAADLGEGQKSEGTGN